MLKLSRWLPCYQWLSIYNRVTLKDDLMAGIIVAIMLIPQSLAYAMLAGLPAEVGLYSSVLPLVIYGLFGTSSTLSVGPVAVTSLMTASALANIAAQGTADYLTAAIALAALSGGILLLGGILGLGFLAKFLSHTVVSAFVSASAIIIAFAQLRQLTGLELDEQGSLALASGVISGATSINPMTAVIGFSVLAYLWLIRKHGKTLFTKLGLPEKVAALSVKAAPIVAIIVTIVLATALGLDGKGVTIVGEIPSGLPPLSVPIFSSGLLGELLVPACLISLIGFVESVSVGRTLGAKKRERINENQELIGLGAANLASSMSGGFPVTGGFSRSVVNFDAGAATQASSFVAAFFIGLVSVFLTPYLYHLPIATLAATIIVAVLSLVDLSILKKTWKYSKSDFSAVALTLMVTLMFGVEVGVSSGVFLSLFLHLYRTSNPHIAEVGVVDGTEHFRNVRRFKVDSLPNAIMLRVDESLFFANAVALEERILCEVFSRDEIAHVVLVCSAINEVDFSALEVLELLNRQLHEQGICLHLAEVKGPVLDRFRNTHFFADLTGNVYLSQFSAFEDIRSFSGYRGSSE
ncbi:MAG: SulP family inorganic anion transporter [Pseudohongiellaceae bacterium]